MKLTETLRFAQIRIKKTHNRSKMCFACEQVRERKGMEKKQSDKRIEKQDDKDGERKISDKKI